METSLIGTKNQVKWVELLVGTTRLPRKRQKVTTLHGIANLQSNKMEMEKIKMIHGKRLLMEVHLPDGVKVIRGRVELMMRVELKILGAAKVTGILEVASVATTSNLILTVTGEEVVVGGEAVVDQIGVDMEVGVVQMVVALEVGVIQMVAALEVGEVFEVEGTEEVLEVEDQTGEDFVVEGVEGGMIVVNGRIEMIRRKINPTVGAKALAVMLRDGNLIRAVGAKITITKAAGRVLIVQVMLMMVDGRKDSTLKRM